MEGTSKVINNNIAKKKNAMSPPKLPFFSLSTRTNFFQRPECNEIITKGCSAAYAAVNGGATSGAAVDEETECADIIINNNDGSEGNGYEVENINGVQFKLGHNIASNMDRTKLRRILSNRVSARKSRMKKLQYVAEMEKKVRALQAEIESLSPQLLICKIQHRQLEMEKNNLTQQLSARTSKYFLTDAEIEANKAEVKRLRQLHTNILQQNRLHTYVMNCESSPPRAATSGPLMFDDQQVMITNRESDHHHDQYGLGQFDYQVIPNLNQDDHKAMASIDEVNYLSQLNTMTRDQYDHQQGHEGNDMANLPANNNGDCWELQQAGLIKEMMIMTPASQFSEPHQNHDQVLNVNRPNRGDGDDHHDDQMKLHVALSLNSALNPAVSDQHHFHFI